MSDGWPELPAFAKFRVATVEEPDGREVHYYDWPGDPVAHEPEDAVSVEASRPAADGGV